jgi:outer membrane immunogenic protein
MKFIALAAAAALATTPAIAQTNAAFTGVRAEVTAGYNDIQNSPDANDVVYGAAVGVDAPLGDRVTIGVEANSSNFFEKERMIGASARLGYAFTPRTLGYVHAGYDNYRDVFSRKLDGFKVGAGVERKISDVTYIKAQYNYSEFDRNTGSHALLAGVGFRF